jgi:RNA polymerase sigma-70 factor (ECF subfamily)
VVRRDASALASLYDRHADWMLGRAYRILGNRRDAEDLVHDVFLEVWHRSASHERDRGSVRAWLSVKTRTRAIDRLRTRGALERLGVRRSIAEPALVESAIDTDPFCCVDRRIALAALAKLPDSQRTVIELCYLEGLPTSEIARRCDLPLGTGKSRLSRGLATLRSHLDQPETEDGT